LKQILYSPLLKIADDILGVWYSKNQIEYLFLPVLSKTNTGIVSIKQLPKGSTILFNYCLSEEDHKIFLEIDRSKYRLTLDETDDERTLMIEVSKDYIIELIKK
jgi:hypothetical protein